MSVVTKLLFYLSKTDRRLVVLCSGTAYKTQASNGIFVLIVGIFAFTSASYALRTALGANWVAYVVAAVYGALIMFIDREIVSATSKNRGMIATRLVLAVFIGLVVSVPIELRLFEQQINQELKRIQNVDNSPYLAKKQQAEAQYRDRILVKEKQIQELETEVGKLGDRISNEVLQPDRQITGVVAGTGRPGVGPVYRRLEEQVEEKAKQLAQVRKDYDKLKEEERNELKRIEDEYAREAIPPADDLLSRYVALGAVKQDPQRGWDAWFMAWGVRLLLIMLELTPALIKVLQEESDYDALLRATLRRSITRVYAIANDHMEQLTQNGGQNPSPTLLEQLKTEPLTS
jgi:hypothetical protein